VVVRALLLIALLAACGREKSRQAPEPPTEKCFADEIGALRGTWNVPAACKESDAACRELCVNGDADACFFVSTENTTTGKDDPKDAPIYFERACRLGLAIGCTNWGAYQLFGRQDPDSADHTPRPSRRCLYRVFSKTCDVGDAFGCSMTARILVEWPRTPADLWIAFSQLSNACDKFDGPPCRFLAYYLDRGDFGAADPAYVKDLLKRACDGGDDEACGVTSAANALHGRDD